MKILLNKKTGTRYLALVCANYTNLKKKRVYETTGYPELFLRNLLLGENNPLKNRDLQISGSLSSPKSNEETENCTLHGMTVLNLLKIDEKMTQRKITAIIKKSEKTAKMITSSLEKKGFITRINGKRFGYWKLNIE